MQGKVWKFGDHIDTDVIIPAPYLVTTDPLELGKHCMEGVVPDFSARVRPGDIIIAGKNFGCGSSREHAPMAIKGVGVACVIAESFARIFFRNAFNMGLLIFEAPGISELVQDGDQVGVNPDTGEIVDYANGKGVKASPVPKFMQDLIDAGGLIAYVMKKKRI